MSAAWNEIQEQPGSLVFHLLGHRKSLSSRGCDLSNSKLRLHEEERQTPGGRRPSLLGFVWR